VLGLRFASVLGFTFCVLGLRFASVLGFSHVKEDFTGRVCKVCAALLF